MARDPEQLTKLILALAKISKPLMEDTARAADELKKHDRKGIKSSRDGQELTFWGKVTTTCLFAHINAVGYAARKCVQLFAGWGDLTLTNREIAKLIDRKYDADTDQLLGPTTPLSSIESLKLGLKYFAKLVGADFTLATGDDRWQGLRTLQTARRRFTHPERIEDLYVLEMFSSLQSSLVWFYGEMSRFFNVVFSAVGQTGFTLSPKIAAHRSRPRPAERFQLFSEKELEDKVVVGGHTLAYAQQFLRALGYDGRRASTIGRKYAAKRGPVAAFARRIALRTQAQQIEALSNLMWFLLESARKRGEISFENSDLQEPPGLPPKLAQLVARVNLWSDRVGMGRKLSPDDATKSTLTVVWKKRDKLLHPFLPKDLEISHVDGLALFLALTDLELQAYGCTEIDRSKWEAAFHRGREHRSKATAPA